MDRYSAVRSRANTVVREYELLSGSLARSENSALAWLEDVAHRCFRLAVVEDSELPDGQIGELDLEIDTISYRTGLAQGRAAFTVAHEIGHCALEHPEPKQIDTEHDIDESPDFVALTVQQGVYRSYNSKSAVELEANVFAIELLAPVQEVRLLLSELQEWSVDGIADHFGISREAALNQISASLKRPPSSSLEETPALEVDPDQDHDDAVETPGPALILAGPGAGKTRILVRRFQRLVEEKSVHPRKILALTFGNRAAAEIRDRLTKAMPEHAHELSVFTFHSFALEALKLFWPDLGFAESPRLLTPAELIAVLKKNLANLPLGCFENLPSPARNLGLLMDAVSRAKDELVEPAEFLSLAERALAMAVENDQETARKAVDAGLFYGAYEQLLHDKSMMDYGSVIALVVRLLFETEAGPTLSSSYEHILVDEFQDINYACGRMVKGLSLQGAKVWAVGDLRQTIYRFRGASPGNIGRFRAEYPGAQFVTLRTNYRSVEDIVRCGQAVTIPIREDARLLPTPHLVSKRGKLADGAGVRLVTAGDGPSEMSSIVSDVKRDIVRYGAQGVSVLCRTRADADRVASALESDGVPTNWSGDLQASPIFKDVFGVLYFAAGDLRGLVRTAGTSEHRLRDDDLEILLNWADEHGPSALVLLHKACEGEIHCLSDECIQTLTKLKPILGSMGYHPTAFHGLASYLFEHSERCRSLIREDSPEARRDLTTIQQLCALARSFRGTPGVIGRHRIREFVEFVEACSESGKLDTVVPDLSDEACVTVSTVHGSKGLEWKSVFVPLLADRKFPNKSRHEPIPIPDGLIKDFDLADEASEESCLFYVAVTRARDRLTLSVADRYARSAQKSPFFIQIEEGLAGTGLSETIRVPDCELEGSTSDPLPGAGYRFIGSVPYGSINSFQRCPKKFEFTHIWKLSSGDKGYLKFRRVLKLTLQWLCSEKSSGNLPSIDEALAKLDAGWELSGPKKHWYESRFRSRASAILAELHQRLRRGDLLSVDEAFDLQVGDRTVGLIIDELEEGNWPVLRRVHYGPAYKSHLGKDPKEHMPALLAAVSDIKFPGRAVPVRIYYPLIPLEKDSLATPTIKNLRLKKMESLIEEAETGPYPPKWSDFTCPSCPYCLICPAGRAEGDPSE